MKLGNPLGWFCFTIELWCRVDDLAMKLRPAAAHNLASDHGPGLGRPSSMPAAARSGKQDACRPRPIPGLAFAGPNTAH